MSLSVLDSFLSVQSHMATHTRLTQPRTLEVRNDFVKRFDYQIGSHHLFAYGNMFELKLSKGSITLIRL